MSPALIGYGLTMSLSQTERARPARAARPRTLVLQSGLGHTERQRLAIADVVEACGLWRLAVTLGWFDIRLRYRGSMLGPFWLTLSTAVMVAALGVLYSRLFNMELHDYLPFLALSLVLWGVLSTIISDACTCFTAAEGTIRSMRMPFTLHPMRIVVRNVIVLAHNVVVILAVYAWFDNWPGWHALVAIPALLVWLIDGLAVCLLLGPIGARFRDIPPIVASVIQIAFFVSPIIWKPELLKGTALELLWLNPFFTLLEIVRAPMLGEAVSLHVWASALGYSAVLVVLAWLLFSRTRARLAFWV
ncbi:MAG: ABC transporter permease [Acetobacteraceae bacterium]|nr:ABC transporter permease [Acetobacteraceae bacterium]